MRALDELIDTSRLAYYHGEMLRRRRITAEKRDGLLKAFCGADLTATDAADPDSGVGVNRQTANLYYSHFRECIWNYLQKAPRFSGEIEMDQGFFGRGIRGRPEDTTIKAPTPYSVPSSDPLYSPIEAGRKPKKPRGKPRKNVQVFGIMQRGGDVYTQIITHADKNTLLPIVHMIVEPGSTIYTDKWAGFNDLGADGYVHRSVNHSDGYVAPDGAHTQNIDLFWKFAKQRLWQFHGINRRTFPFHLKECELRYNMRKDKRGFAKLIKRLAFPRKKRAK